MDNANRLANPFDVIINKLHLIEHTLAIKQPDPNAIPYLKTEEAAAFLSTNTNTLRVMACKKQIPHIKKHRKLYFRRSDLVDWLESGSVDASIGAPEDILLLNKKRS